MSEIRDLLNEEIKSQIKDLASLETGSKEKSSAVDDLANLYRLSNPSHEPNHTRGHPDTQRQSAEPGVSDLCESQNA